MIVLLALAALGGLGVGLVMGELRLRRRAERLAAQVERQVERQLALTSLAGHMQQLLGGDRVTAFDAGYDAGFTRGVDARAESVAAGATRRYGRSTTRKRPRGVGAPGAMARKEHTSHAPRA